MPSSQVLVVVSCFEDRMMIVLEEVIEGTGREDTALPLPLIKPADEVEEEGDQVSVLVEVER